MWSVCSEFMRDGVSYIILNSESHLDSRQQSNRWHVVVESRIEIVARKTKIFDPFPASNSFHILTRGPEVPTRLIFVQECERKRRRMREKRRGILANKFLMMIQWVSIITLIFPSGIYFIYTIGCIFVAWLLLSQMSTDGAIFREICVRTTKSSGKPRWKGLSTEDSFYHLRVFINSP